MTRTDIAAASGRARAAKLSPEERTAGARTAANARWSGRRRGVGINTTLDPLTYAGLAFLAAREDPGQAAANVPLARLVREELDRLHPGLWDWLVAQEAQFFHEKGLPPRELAAELFQAAQARAAHRDGGAR